jgi:MYXO-CTERM domain-containing protein
MFNPTLSNTDNKSRSAARLKAIVKPLALMAALLSVSPTAFAVIPCDEDQAASATAECDSWSTATTTFFLDSCGVSAGGDIAFECCTFGHCDGGLITGGVDSDGELAEDRELAEDGYPGDPVDPSSTPDDADELVDEEPGFSEDDGDTLGDDEGDTGRDDSDDGDDEGDTGYADAGDMDTGDDGFDTGDADDTSADDEDASADDDDTQSDGDVDTKLEASDTSAGCSTTGQGGGGLMALILGALLGLTRRQVRWI